jgi:hypothetical protein
LNRTSVAPCLLEARKLPDVAGKFKVLPDLTDVFFASLACFTLE